MSDLESEVGSDGAPEEGTRRLQAFMLEHPVDPRFLSGMDPDEPDILQLVANFGGCGFTWTGAVGSWAGVLGGAVTGDCKTIVDACYHLATEGYGLEVGIGYEQKDFFVPNGGAITDGRTGNVDGAHWVFTNHYWLTTTAGDFDLLFCGVPFDRSAWLEVSETGQERVDERNVVDWRKFGDWYVYLHSSGNGYTVEFDNAFKSPSRSEEAMRLDKEKEGPVEKKAEKSTEELERERLEDIFGDLEFMAPDLNEQWRRWTAEQVFALTPPLSRASDRKPVYMEFGSGNMMNPAFDRVRFETWARGRGATDFSGAYT